MAVEFNCIELNNIIYLEELELADLKKNLSKLKFELKNLRAEIILHTDWKKHNITNEHGREAFIQDKSKEKLKEIGMMEYNIHKKNARIDCLLRELDLQKE